MGRDDELLAELRSVFRGELEDQLATIAREVERLASAGHDAKLAGAAIAEIYRAAHSLKGAARAVEEPEIARICHALETELSGARGEPLAHAARVRELAVRAAREIDAASAKHRGAPAPAAPAADPGPEPARGESVRVDVARLRDLFSAAQALLTVASRHVAARPVTEDALAALRADALRLRELLSGRELDRGSATRHEALQLADRLLAGVETTAAASNLRAAQLARTWDEVGTTARDVEAGVRALRVVRFDTLQGSLEATARDAAHVLGREATIEVAGGDVEFDRRVRDGLREPLLHLVRNAVGHGIETADTRARTGKPRQGRISVAATLAGRDVRIAVADDGAGIDVGAVRAAARARGIPDNELSDEPAILRQVFAPGVSTSAEVSSISGRGVGLDIVARRVGEMQGTIELTTHPGRGTRFEIIVPIDLSVVRAVVARVRDAQVAIVTTAVARLARARAADVTTIEGHLFLRDEMGLVPLADLDVLLGWQRRAASRIDEQDARPVIVLGAGRRVAFRVDALLDERDVVVKQLGPRVERAAFVAGATVLADGEIALVLDAAALTRHARPARAADDASPASSRPRHRILVVDDSITTRQLVRTILQSAGYDVAVAHDGAHAWETLSSAEVPFDAVVSDIEMPRMDGFQLVARVRATPRTERLPIVLVTALDRAADRQRALDLGASAYVVKSGFDQELLLDTLAELL